MIRFKPPDIASRLKPLTKIAGSSPHLLGRVSCGVTYRRSMSLDPLTELAVEISKCVRCDQDGIHVVHAPAMARGSGRGVLVIGVQPGRTEVKQGIAFSGPAG